MFITCPLHERKKYTFTINKIEVNSYWETPRLRSLKFLHANRDGSAVYGRLSMCCHLLCESIYWKFPSVCNTILLKISMLWISSQGKAKSRGIDDQMNSVKTTKHILWYSSLYVILSHSFSLLNISAFFLNISLLHYMDDDVPVCKLIDSEPIPPFPTEPPQAASDQKGNNIRS